MNYGRSYLFLQNRSSYHLHGHLELRFASESLAVLTTRRYLSECIETCYEQGSHNDAAPGKSTGGSWLLIEESET